ncbi:caspase family protein [Kitasatospora sp. Root107]|uniref:caspase family protein n=1 Tax=Kitasatospora sp. Root107 TaxID=1736424 RepID=UPI00070C05D5|nr:caspase family protein [Kitasatospora sp. Root107]KQV13676.1 hypothetical protein ASC99_33365 [Kitasatospora sp. Root107]
MKGLPDPASSRAVLIGVGGYTVLEPLPAVAHNLPALAGALTARHSWGLPPEHCTVVAEPSSLHEMLAPVEQAARACRDTLLVYFAGHGLTDDRGELVLGLPRSEPGKGHTGVPYSMLRSAIMAGRAQRHVIVLDCCFSGKALGLMGGSVADQAEIDGSYLLAAAPETGLALAPPGERYTAFTGELLRVLDQGIEGAGPWLDLESVYRHLRATLAAKGRPQPQKRDRNTAGRLLLGRNHAHLPGVTTVAPAEGPGRHWPDPAALETVTEFIDALGEVRALSGLALRVVGERCVPPLSAATISGLLNRTTVPQRWRSTGSMLLACGLPPDQIEHWHGAWNRLKAVSEGLPSGASAAPESRPPRGWRRLLDRSGRR